MAAVTQAVIPIRWQADGRTHTATLGEYQVTVTLDPIEGQRKLVKLTQGPIVWQRFFTGHSLQEIKERAERWLHGGRFWIPDEEVTADAHYAAHLPEGAGRKR